MRAVILGLLCGLFIPPLRPSMVLSLQMPPSSANAGKRKENKDCCIDPDCKTPLCRGNRIVRVTRDNQPHLDLRFPHHKTQSSRKAQQAEIETSIANTSKLFHFIQELLDWGWQLMRKEHIGKQRKGGNGRGRPKKEPETLALWHTGRTLQPRGCAEWWRSVGTDGAPAGSVPHVPRDCRHLFVTAVRDNNLATPEEEGIVATIMGNSRHAWDLRYDMHRHQRGVNVQQVVVDKLHDVLLAKLEQRNE